MAAASIDLGDFTCSICREIFDKPVSLTCSHAYCYACLDGMKKPSSSPSSDESTSETSSTPQTAPVKTLIYKPQLHETNRCFTCAICRKESWGYFDSRDLETDLKTIEAPCSICGKSLMLCDLRKHTDTCKPPEKKLDANAILKAFNPDFFKQLSQPQAEALEKARAGDNRSTFPCPYCNEPNFTVENLCKHIEQSHFDEHPSRVCPICAAMPWGDKERRSTNVYQHIMSRHRFDYSTYVNYEQDEEAMLAEAVERSMIYH